MSGLLQRPEAHFDPARGLLRNEHFQVAYVTSDLERACDLFRQRFGIEDFGGLGGEMPSGGHIQVRLAWVGSTMYELIECSGPGTAMYNDALPEEGFGVRFHHLGFLVPDRAAWDALQATIAGGGWEITQSNDTPGFMRHCYIRVPELGHYCEYMLPEPAAIDFFNNVPAS